MKIALSTFGCDSGRSGIGRYAINIIQQMIALNQFELELLCHANDRDIFDPNHQLETYEVEDCWSSPFKNIIWHQLKLPRVVRQRGYDCVFFLAGNRRLPFALKCLTVGTVHDLSSLHVTGKYDRAREFYIHYILPTFVRNLDHVITVSKSSRDDIMQFIGIANSKISVIPLGVEAPHIAVDHKTPRKPILLYVSRVEHPGKNHINLISAFEKLKQDVGFEDWELVCAGPLKERSNEVLAFARQSKVANRIRFTGFIDDQELEELYNHASLLVFPSYYEGFGLPILEAMVRGLPVVCSDRGSIPEIAGDVAIQFDPSSSESIKEAISRVLTDQQLSKKMAIDGLQHCKKYTWENTAVQTIKIIQSLIAKSAV